VVDFASIIVRCICGDDVLVVYVSMDVVSLQNARTVFLNLSSFDSIQVYTSTWTVFFCNFSPINCSECTSQPHVFPATFDLSLCVIS